MLKRYKNALLEAVQQAGLDATQFRVTEDIIHQHPSFVLHFQNTPMMFVIRNPEHDFHIFDCSFVGFSPSYSDSSYYPHEGFEDFENILPIFKDWLNHSINAYLEEMLIPDMWSQIESQKSIMNGSSIGSDDTSNFSFEEKTELRLALQEFRLLVAKNFTPSDEEMKLVSDRLEYLAEATNRLNRFDWRGLVISTLLSISTTLSLDTNSGRLLYGLFQQAFNAALRLLPG